ncbi:MAG TPA: flagellar biosynthesis protein FlgN [Desulfovibrio sp.]|nr:flagellar biosynthesis protein FlgN [Desulfovibrio sp.]HBR07246.1 flagellar biosynthesis protein FlgN [Desulfovibrio sp.]
MIGRIQENLSRQLKALGLLEELLEEEFSYLKTSKPQAVSRVEISIQELMRQLTVERLSLRALVQEVQPGAKRVREILDGLEPEQGEALRTILSDLDHAEQVCARRAAKNQNLVLALFQQSRNLLQYLQDRILPKGTAYAASGRMARAASNPTLVTGRL